MGLPVGVREGRRDRTAKEWFWAVRRVCAKAQRQRQAWAGRREPGQSQQGEGRAGRGQATLPGGSSQMTQE